MTISGAVAAPGVYELAFGTPMGELLAAAGGATEPLRALLVGGYFGTWVEASQALGLRLARDDLRSVGCSLGPGVLIALGESSCGLHESARVIDYLARESAGQCGPCGHGLRAIADLVGELADGVAHPREAEHVRRWTAEIGPGYARSPEGQQAPLRRIYIRDQSKAGVALARPVNATPTFVLVEDGQEVGRIPGYAGRDFFYPALDELLQRIPAPAPRPPLQSTMRLP